MYMYFPLSSMTPESRPTTKTKSNIIFPNKRIRCLNRIWFHIRRYILKRSVCNLWINWYMVDDFFFSSFASVNAIMWLGDLWLNGETKEKTGGEKLQERTKNQLLALGQLKLHVLAQTNNLNVQLKWWMVLIDNPQLTKTNAKCTNTIFRKEE